MTFPTFGEIDKRFVGTSLENEESFTRDDKDRARLLSSLDEVYNIVTIVDRYRGRCNIHYPGYFVKGKNGPYFFRAALVIDERDDDDYTYYRGVYLGLSTDNVCMYIDGNDITVVYGRRMFDYVTSLMNPDEIKCVEEFEKDFFKQF